MTKEEQIAYYIKKYECTREEAIGIIEEDEEVDKMTSSKQIDADLTEEQRKAKKEQTKVGTRKTEKKTEIVRKKDDEKVQIVEEIAEFAKNLYKNAEIVNAGQEICFIIGENSYSLKLVKHRPPKK